MRKRVMYLLMAGVLALGVFAVSARYAARQEASAAMTDWEPAARRAIVLGLDPALAVSVYEDSFYAYLGRGGHGRPNVEEAHQEALKAVATAPQRYRIFGEEYDTPPDRDGGTR